MNEQEVKYTEDHEYAIVCAHCGEWYTHHDEVQVFSRHEDADTVGVTTVTSTSTTKEFMPNAASGNPSSRRDGLTVDLWCECCLAYSRLTLAQHKGVTLLTMTPLDKRAVA